MLMVQAMLCGKEGLFFLSPAPVGRSSTQPPARRAYAPEGEHRENNSVQIDSVTPERSVRGKKIPLEVVVNLRSLRVIRLNFLTNG